MLTNEFSYVLPERLIAQYPARQRDASRLLCLEPGVGIKDIQFSDLPLCLEPGDLLVLNDTRVISAKLFARKATGGKVEILLERILDDVTLLVQLRANKSLKPGTVLILDKENSFEVLGRRDDMYLLKYQGQQMLLELLNQHGHIPLPPYINRTAVVTDKERYQTVFSDKSGAVAAPTAGLHFTDQILKRLQKKKIDNVKITLHVGAGTFQPVRVRDIEHHKMHSEFTQVSQDVVDKINTVKEKGGKILAVGTTVVRSLETAACSGKLAPYEGETDIFIYPGFKFNIVDRLLTNFHLSESTLLMLVCAFGGQDNVMQAYRHAIEKEYRFYSYGDAMLILNKQ